MEFFQLNPDLPDERWISTLKSQLDSIPLMFEEVEIIDFTSKGLPKRESGPLDQFPSDPGFESQLRFPIKLWRRLSAGHKRLLYNLLVSIGNLPDWYLDILKQNLRKLGIREILLDTDLIRSSFKNSSDSDRRKIRMRTNELYKYFDDQNLSFSDFIKIKLRYVKLRHSETEKRRLRTPSAARSGSVNGFHILQKHKEYDRNQEILYERKHQFEEDSGYSWDDIYNIEYLNPLYEGKMWPI